MRRGEYDALASSIHGAYDWRRFWRLVGAGRVIRRLATGRIRGETE